VFLSHDWQHHGHELGIYQTDHFASPAVGCLDPLVRIGYSLTPRLGCGWVSCLPFDRIEQTGWHAFAALKRLAKVGGLRPRKYATNV